MTIPSLEDLWVKAQQEADALSDRAERVRGLVNKSAAIGDIPRWQTLKAELRQIEARRISAQNRANALCAVQNRIYRIQEKGR